MKRIADFDCLAVLTGSSAADSATVVVELKTFSESTRNYY